MKQKMLTGMLLDERSELSLDDLSMACSSSVEWITELVDEGVLEPTGEDRSEWRFPGTSLHRAIAAMRLHRDLDINLAGVALALDMLDEIEALRSRLRRVGIDDDT